MLRPKSPISLQVELTDACNHHCTHCYNFWRTDDYWKFEKSDSSNLLRIADKIIEAEVFHVVLSGGEPLVVPIATLEELVDKYKSGGVSVSFNSNITLVKSAHIEMFKKYGLSILTSVPSYNQEDFERITMKKGSFDSFVDSAKLISGNGVYLSSNMVVNKQTLNDVYTTGKFMASLGAKGFCATRMSPSNNGIITDYSSTVLDRDDMVSMLDQLLAVHEDFGLTVNSLNAIPYCFTDNPLKYSMILNRSCVAGLTSGGMSSKGDLRACQHFDISYGNVLDEPLQDIWSRMTVWKYEYLSTGECKGCVEQQRCGGGCRENAHKIGGDFNGKDSITGKPLTQKVREDIIDCIDAIKLVPNIKVRDEDFGAVFFKQSNKYCLVDKFTSEAIKNLYSRNTITKKDMLEVGSDCGYVDSKYVDKVFSNLVNNGLAYKNMSGV